MSRKVVRSRLLKLDETHIACVLDTMQERPYAFLFANRSVQCPIEQLRADGNEGKF